MPGPTCWPRVATWYRMPSPGWPGGLIGPHASSAPRRRKTTFERDAFLEANLPEKTDADAACRWLLARTAGETRRPGLAGRLGRDARRGRRRGSRRASSRRGRPARDRPPGGCPRPPAGPARDGGGPVGLARMRRREPGAAGRGGAPPAALAGDRARGARSLPRGSPELRVRALIRGGTVNVPSLDGPEIGRRLDAAIPGASKRSPPRSAGSRPTAPRTDSPIFSSMPPAWPWPRPRPPKPFRGPSPMTWPAVPPSASCSSGSSLCRRPPASSSSTPRSTSGSGPGGRWRSIFRTGPGLAVEIDGYYHFQDADAYRRDRRKDLELQKRGFLVVRVLAEDVVRGSKRS